MARICPLCHEEVDTDSKWPHICKAIPMPTIGQCPRCGTALNELNVSELFPDLCMGCHKQLPGNRDEAIQFIYEKGRVILPKQKMLWVYVTYNNRLLLDLCQRSYGGRVNKHRYTWFKWTCYALKEILVVARDLQTRNPELAMDVLRYCREPSGDMRIAIAEGIVEKYEKKCIHMNDRPAPTS